MPNQKKDVIDIYLNNDRAHKYREMDRAMNNGYLPEPAVRMASWMFWSPACRVPLPWLGRWSVKNLMMLPTSRSFNSAWLGLKLGVG